MTDSFLVVGGSGFLSSHLSEYLSRSNINVIRFSSRSLSSLSCGQLVETLKAHSPHVVVYAAGIAHTLHNRCPDLYLEYNSYFPYRLARASSDALVPYFYYISSVSVYGILSSQDPLDVTTARPSPVTIYGHSKLMAEKLIISLSRHSKTSFHCLRLPLCIDSNAPGNIQRLETLFRLPIPVPVIDSNVRACVFPAHVAAIIMRSASEQQILGPLSCIVSANLSFADLALYVAHNSSKRCRSWFVHLSRKWTLVIALLTLIKPARRIYGNLTFKNANKHLGVLDVPLSLE